MLTHFSSVIMRVRDLDVEKRASVGQSGEGREPSQSCPGRGEGGAWCEDLEEDCGVK